MITLPTGLMIGLFSNHAIRNSLGLITCDMNNSSSSNLVVEYTTIVPSIELVTDTFTRAYTASRGACLRLMHVSTSNLKSRTRASKSVV